MVRCFHLQSRPFFSFHLLQQFSLSFFCSYTGMAFLRSASIIPRTVERSIAEAAQHGTLHYMTVWQPVFRMQNDTSSEPWEFCTEEIQQSIASRHFTSCFPLPGRGTLRFLPVESQTTLLWRSSIGRQPATRALQTTRDNTQVYLCRTAFSCNSLNVVCFRAEARRCTSGRGDRRLDKWDIYVCALFSQVTFLSDREPPLGTCRSFLFSAGLLFGRRLRMSLLSFDPSLLS